jgi:MFS family permease
LQLQEQERLWSKNFVLLFFIGIFSTTISYALNNSVPLYVTQSGGSTVLSGSMITSLTVGGVVGRVFSGRLVDTAGRRKIMIVYSLGFVAVTVLPALFPSFTLLLAVRFMQGLFTSGATTASMAAVADVVPRARMGEGIGYSSLSMIAGPCGGAHLGIALLAARADTGLFSGYRRHHGRQHRAGLELPLRTQTPAMEKNRARGQSLPACWRSSRACPGQLFEKKALGPASSALFFAPGERRPPSLHIPVRRFRRIRTEPYFTAQAAGMFLTRIGTARFPTVTGQIIMPAAAAGAAAFLLIAFTSGAVGSLRPLLIRPLLGVTIPLLNARR